MESGIAQLLSWFFDGIPAAIILGALAWAFQNPISQLVHRSISTKFDVRLARIEGEIRQQGTEVDSVRQHLLTELLARNASLNARKTEALEQIWVAHCSWRRLAIYPRLLQSINIDEMSKASSDEKVQKFASTLLKAFGDIDKFLVNPPIDATLQRPFVDEHIWELYQAHLSIISFSLVTLKAWDLGIDPRRTAPIEPVHESIKAALPGMADYIDKYPESAGFFMVEQLDSALLMAIRKELKGGSDERVRLRREGGLIASRAEKLAVDGRFRGFRAAIPAASSISGRLILMPAAFV